jgi:hypothetical protein
LPVKIKGFFIVVLGRRTLWHLQNLSYYLRDFSKYLRGLRCRDTSYLVKNRLTNPEVVFTVNTRTLDPDRNIPTCALCSPYRVLSGTEPHMPIGDQFKFLPTSLPGLSLPGFPGIISKVDKNPSQALISNYGFMESKLRHSSFLYSK